MSPNIFLRAFAFGAVVSCALGASIATVPDNHGDIGSWHFSTKMDPIDDSRSSIIEVVSGGKDFRLQCDKQGPGSIYPLFGSDQYLGGKGADYDRRPLTIRFDSDPALSEDWIYKGNIAFLHPRINAASARNVEARIAQSTKLAVRAITYDGQFVDAVFDLTGSKEAVAKLQESCNDNAVTPTR